MKLLACDVGTTHCKAGLFDMDGTACCIASHATPMDRAADEGATLDPERLWQTVTAVLAEAAAAACGEPIAAVGIASMAETGLLVDRRAGRPRSGLVPWFDPRAAPQAEKIGRQEDPFAIFQRSGLRASYKCGLAKILWLQQREPAITEGAVWLSAADFVAQRLTGQVATDPTLAARTLAYRIDAGHWDADWIASLGLDAALFPTVLPSGQPMGETTLEAAAATGSRLRPGIPVAICGHDHVVAALSVGAVDETILDSIGTAEALVGALPSRPLTRDHFASGLVFGPHIIPGRMFWMGALSAAGRSLDWLRGILGDPQLSYEACAALIEQTTPEPVDLLYLPYLLGAQAPWPNSSARGAFVGLADAHGRGDLMKAVLQGVAYEMACILQAAETATGCPMRSLTAVGGGVRVPSWLQIRADVIGRPVVTSPHAEATLLGAAVACATGVGADIHRGEIMAQAATSSQSPVIYQPDPSRHRAHQRLLDIYRTLQAPLRAAASGLASQGRGGITPPDRTKGGSVVKTNNRGNVVTLREVLPLAEAGGYAVGSFSPRYTAMIQHVLRAGQQMRSPLIVQISANELRWFSSTAAEFAEEFHRCLVSERITAPVVLHLDHTKDPAIIADAIAAGFTSVMIDRSELPLADNIARTTEVVAYAHSRGVSVEAELGRIFSGDKIETEEDRELFTMPEEAELFARETSVDALAVSVGTAHGVYMVRKPMIDFDRLQAIRRLTRVHLVLHGGSGVPAEMLTQAFRLPGGGVSKVNIATDLEQAMLKALGRSERMSNIELEALPADVRATAGAAVETEVREKIEHFLSSAGRAAPMS